MLTWRERAGLTQAEAAQRAGTSSSTWGHLERHGAGGPPPRSAPTAETVRGLARAMAMPVAELLRLTDHEPTQAEVYREAIDRLSGWSRAASELAAAISAAVAELVEQERRLGRP